MKAGMFLAMKYDRMFMRLDEICEEIGIAVSTARQKMMAGTFPIPMRKPGKFLIADVRDVGKYLDDVRDGKA